MVGLDRPPVDVDIHGFPMVVQPALTQRQGAVFVAHINAGGSWPLQHNLPLKLLGLGVDRDDIERRLGLEHVQVQGTILGYGPGGYGRSLAPLKGE